MAVTRVLRIKLREPVIQALATTSKASLAKAIGISRPKLNAIIKEEWSYITRDAIERTADYFQLETGQVFELAAVDFWQPLEHAKQCTFLRGSHDGFSIGVREMRIPYFDSLATGIVERFFRERVPMVSDTLYADHLREDREVVDRAKRENCIVIGSPQSNAASEILLSRFFEAEPFEPSTFNRRKIPFGFCWPESQGIAKQSSLACSDLARIQLRGRNGIALRGGYEVRADFRPDAEYKAWQTTKGVDCGLIFVANRPFGSLCNVKLIVLAGLHGVGTLGAATALVEDFRYLEPSANEACVFGIVEAYYSKPKNSLDRTYRGYAWKYRLGGCSPILPTDHARIEAPE